MEKLSGMLSTRSNHIETLGKLREELVSCPGLHTSGADSICAAVEIFVKCRFSALQLKALLWT